MDNVIARPTRRRRRRLELSGMIAASIAALIICLALFGPFLSPHDPDAIVGVPYTESSSAVPLGTDFLGRDVLSRVLNGGRSVVLLAALATVLGYLVGSGVGLAAGYVGGWTDAILMRSMDVLLAFPPILFLLILATGAGPSKVALVAGIAVIHVPSVARILRTATLQTAVRGYVEAAIARGERMFFVIAREIVPNITGVIAADAGPRFTVSILLVAALNFLGLGLQPPTADWALMISENRSGLTTQALAVAVPAAVIAMLTITINVLGDAIAHSRDRSINLETIRR